VEIMQDLVTFGVFAPGIKNKIKDEQAYEKLLQLICLYHKYVI
jgi:hypothetical protein